jgi:hypothetical protein
MHELREEPPRPRLVLEAPGALVSRSRPRCCWCPSCTRASRSSYSTALIAALVLGLFNTLVRPPLVLTLPVTMLTR